MFESFIPGKKTNSSPCLFEDRIKKFRRYHIRKLDRHGIFTYHSVNCYIYPYKGPIVHIHLQSKPKSKRPFKTCRMEITMQVGGLISLNS